MEPKRSKNRPETNADRPAPPPVPKVGSNIFPESIEPNSFEASIIEGEASAVLEILDEKQTVDNVVQVALHAAGCSDAMTEQLAARGKLSRPACEKGCVYCCHLPNVSTAIPEVITIVEYLKERIEPGELDNLRRRIDGFVDRVEGLTTEQRNATRLPCPLLVDSMCMAYEVRPLACRGWNSLDVSKCEEDFRHPEQKGVTTLCRLQRAVATSVRLGMYAGLRFAGLLHDRVNLVAALKIALDSPHAVRRWLTGGSFLDTDGSD